MKHTLFSALLLPLLLVSCQSAEEDIVTGEDTVTVKFQVMAFEQVSMGSETTTGTRASAVSSLAHLVVAVYDAQTLLPVGEPIKQNAGDTGYGTAEVTLPYGNYTIVVLGYDGTRDVQLGNPRAIRFAENYVPNMFYRTLSLEANAQTEKAQSVVLTRGVASFSLVADGQIPKNLASIRVEAKGGSHTFDALTGYAPSAVERAWNYTSAAQKAGQTYLDLNFYTFLTAQESTMDFTVTAFADDDLVLRTRTFTAVPMRINQRSRFIGDFFAPDASAPSFSISLDTDEWQIVDNAY